MGIRESLLNTITSVGNGDFVRIVTSAGASSKATVANLFKSFESGLSAKSSLTTSDYIRVVGSDNVSYKQKVSNVKTAFGIDTLNSNTNLYAQAKEIYGAAAINDADNAPVRSVYIAYTTAAHVPQQGILYTWGGNTYRAQLLVCGNCMYTRAKAGSESWSSWYKYTGTAQ